MFSLRLFASHISFEANYNFKYLFSLNRNFTPKTTRKYPEKITSLAFENCPATETLPNTYRQTEQRVKF